MYGRVALVVGLALAAAGSAGVRAHADGQSLPPNRSYLALLDQYQRGEFDEAVETFLEWSPEEYATARPRELAEHLTPGRLKAMVALHLEVIMRGRPTDVLLPPVEEAGARLSRREPGSEEFLVLWRVVAGSCLLWQAKAPQAERIVGNDADPRLQLLAGSIKEYVGTYGLGGNDPLTIRQGTASSRWDESGYQSSGRRTALLAAEVRYRRILDVTPAAHEARLRLGRVLTMLDRPDDARVELERVVAGVPKGYLRYLAQLFIGSIDERAGRTEAARSHYQAAVDEYPAAQTARLALGHLIESQTGRPEGWAEVRRMLEDAGSNGPVAHDPWWMYRYGQAWQLSQLVEQLRQELRR